MLLISGGDRHGVEPNANINLTNATSFTELVHEIRREKKSDMLFMPQYAEPWKHRILQSTIDAVRDYPEFPQGSRTWDERVYHPDKNGVDRPLCELWPDGTAPRSMRWGIALVRLLGRGRSPAVCAWPGARTTSCALPWASTNSKSAISRSSGGLAAARGIAITLAWPDLPTLLTSD